MSEKTLKTRIQNKRGTTAEWATGTAPNFVPLDGELVIYKDVNKIKIGDGSTKVGDLPFVVSNGLDALTYSGIINVETKPQVGHTISYAPAFASSFNRTPIVGDVLNVLVNHNSNSDSYMCTIEVTEYTSPTLKGTYVNVTQATGKDGKNGVNPLVWEGGVFYTRDNVAIGATVNMGPTSSFNRTPVAGDTYNVLLTQRDENDAEIASYFCQLKITQVVGGAFVSEITNLTKATGTDSKVKDVTLGGESMVNANGVVELQQTVMTNNYIPVWDNTEKIFKDGYNRNNVVTTDTAQTITGKKTFGGEPPVFDTGFTATAGTTFDADAAFNTELDLNCPLRANNSLGTLGQVLTSQGAGNSPQWKNIPTPSNMVTTDTEQSISGVKRFVSNSSQYPQTIISTNGIGIQSSQNNTTVYSTSITKVSGGSPITINLPSSGGTLALTNQIPIKTATLSGTTLSITLS